MTWIKAFLPHCWTKKHSAWTPVSNKILCYVFDVGLLFMITLLYPSFPSFLQTPKVPKHSERSHPAHGWQRRERGVCADSIWLHWQRCRGPSLQERGDPYHPGEARGAVVECQEQRGACRDDPCALRGEIGTTSTPHWPAFPWIPQLKQLWDPWACPCPCPRLCPATDTNTFTIAPWHTWRYQSSTIHAEWARHGKGHPETSAMCLWQNSSRLRGIVI